MDDEERQELMESFTVDNEARAAALKVKQKEWKAGQAKVERPVNSGGGTITVDGKSLSRVTAEHEERDGTAFIGKNPEDVVIGKREDWNNGQ